MSDTFQYDFLNDQLMNMGAINTVSQLQGMLCGCLSAGLKLEGDKWHVMAMEFLGLDDLEAGETDCAVFDVLLEGSKKSLADLSFGFHPLLPNDELSLTRRAEELGGWCEGFLHGVGRGIGSSSKSGAGDKELVPEVADALRDMAHITQVALDEDLESEENEIYWTELVEYLRVAVLTVYSELSEADANLAPPAGGDSAEPTLH